MRELGVTFVHDTKNMENVVKCVSFTSFGFERVDPVVNDVATNYRTRVFSMF